MNKSENESKYWVACGALWVAFSILLGAAGKHILMADGAEIRAENLSTASQFGMIMGLSPNGARRFALDAVLVCICSMA